MYGWRYHKDTDGKKFYEYVGADPQHKGKVMEQTPENYQAFKTNMKALELLDM